MIAPNDPVGIIIDGREVQATVVRHLDWSIAWPGRWTESAKGHHYPYLGKQDEVHAIRRYWVSYQTVDGTRHTIRTSGELQRV